ADTAFEHGVLVDQGEARLDGVPLGLAELGYLPPGAATLELHNPGPDPARLILLGGEPFEDVVRVLDKAEATSERYIEGTFFLRARVEGNDIGYGSICAAGPHATTLHWVRN
ncbi:hypothetical protein ADL35_18670, partial [Streptomyces sp. NRRL WC-3753]